MLNVHAVAVALCGLNKALPSFSASDLIRNCTAYAMEPGLFKSHIVQDWQNAAKLCKSKEEQMLIRPRIPGRTNLIVLVGVSLAIAMSIIACTSGEPTEVTRIVEVLVEPEPMADEDMNGTYPKVSLSMTEARILSSEKTGRDYEISVALPASYEGGSITYPVLYVLEPYFWFGIVTDLSRSLAFVDGLSETVLVGIGYPTDNIDEIGVLRMKDLFTEDAAFLEFLNEELIPIINEDYRVKPDEAVLFGHSLGGMFTLYALFQDPHVFSGYIIGSPALMDELDDKYFDEEANYADSNTDLEAKVFMGVGTVRDVSISDVQQMATALEERDYDSLELTTTVFEGETHVSVYPVITNYGMKKMFE